MFKNNNQIVMTRKNVRKLIYSLGGSLVDVAKNVGYSGAYLYGEAPLPKKAAVKLADYLDIPLNKLIIPASNQSHKYKNKDSQLVHQKVFNKLAHMQIMTNDHYKYINRRIDKLAHRHINMTKLSNWITKQVNKARQVNKNQQKQVSKPQFDHIQHDYTHLTYKQQSDYLYKILKTLCTKPFSACTTGKYMYPLAINYCNLHNLYSNVDRFMNKIGLEFGYQLRINAEKFVNPGNTNYIPFLNVYAINSESGIPTPYELNKFFEAMDSILDVNNQIFPKYEHELDLYFNIVRSNVISPLYAKKEYNAEYRIATSSDNNK